MYRVAFLPAELPPIDWEFYSKVIPDISAKYKKQYEALKITFPKNIDTELSILDERHKEMVI